MIHGGKYCPENFARHRPFEGYELICDNTMFGSEFDVNQGGFRSKEFACIERAVQRKHRYIFMSKYKVWAGYNIYSWMKIKNRDQAERKCRDIYSRYVNK